MSGQGGWRPPDEALGASCVIDVRAMRRLETVPTEPGAHTTALDGRRHWLYVFLPETHRAAVFADES
jgi:hypothetical protein